MKKPINEVFEAICQAGLFQYEYKSEDECGFHACTAHSINECVEFERFVQDLMDKHVLQVCHQRKEGEVFTEEECLPQRLKPLVIQFTKAAAPMSSGWQPLVIQTPSPFAYKDNKVVPWSYGASIVQGEQKEELVEQDKTTIDNIFGIGGMTKSGRLFAHPDLRGETSYGKNREEIAMEKAKSYLKGKVVQVDLEPEERGSKEITDEDASEFLKFIQQSEYKVVDQLNRMPAKVSLLELLMYSTAH